MITEATARRLADAMERLADLLSGQQVADGLGEREIGDDSMEAAIIYGPDYLMQRNKHRREQSRRLKRGAEK